jgi:hypothetical protein
LAKVVYQSYYYALLEGFALSIVFFVFWISGPSVAEGDETKHKAAGRRQPGRPASQLDRAFCAMEDFEDCELAAAFWKR